MNKSSGSRSKGRSEGRSAQAAGASTAISPTEEQWRAIIDNDGNYDYEFIYGVATTGIFCRPSCRSRAPKREHVQTFRTADQAQSAGFRPCKRCKPTGQRLPDQEWADQIKQYIDTHYNEPLNLNTLAQMCHGSPFHLQRTFKRTIGLSPALYVQQTRMNKAKELLIRTDGSVLEISRAVGHSNPTYFVTLFKKMAGLTPAAYRQQNSRSRLTEVPSNGNND